MEESVIFALHTEEAKHQISRREVDGINAYFGADVTGKDKYRTDFYTQGITKLWIETVQGKSRPRYYLHAIINFARAVGYGYYVAMPYTLINIRKVITRVGKVLRILGLQGDNADFAQWRVERFDGTFEIFVRQIDLMMLLLNRSLDLSDKKRKCVFIQTDTPESSMRFGNASYRYNIYVKLEQLLREGRVLTDGEMAEVECLLRMERQNFPSAIKKLLPDRTVGNLADGRVREAILSAMRDDMEAFFGKGDYVSRNVLMSKYNNGHADKIMRIKDAMEQITRTSLREARHLYTDEIRRLVEVFGFAPTAIHPREVKKYGVERLEGIYTRVLNKYPKPRAKRSYHDFPVPCKTGDGRFKAKITLYSCSEGVVLKQVVGRTRAEYEEKVKDLLFNTFHDNHFWDSESDDADKKEMIRKSADSLFRFSEVVETESVRRNLAAIIYQCKLKEIAGCVGERGGEGGSQDVQ